MTAFVVSVLYVLVWRLCVLACGLVSIILGYRLFKLGFTTREGKLEAGLGSKTIKVSQFAPGTFFALFGAVIIANLVLTSPSEIVIPASELSSTAEVDMGSGSLTVRGK